MRRQRFTSKRKSRTARRDPRSALELRRLALRAKRSPAAREVLHDALLETTPAFQTFLDGARREAQQRKKNMVVLFTPPSRGRLKGSLHIRAEDQKFEDYIAPAGSVIVFTAHYKSPKPRKSHAKVIAVSQHRARSGTRRDATGYSGHRAYGGVRMCPCPGEERHPSMLTYDPEDPNFGRDRSRRKGAGTRTGRRDLSHRGSTIRLDSGRYVVKSQHPNGVVVARGTAQNLDPLRWAVASRSPHDGKWTVLGYFRTFGIADYDAEKWSKKQLYKSESEYKSERAGRLLGSRISPRRDKRLRARSR